MYVINNNLRVLFFPERIFQLDEKTVSNQKLNLFVGGTTWKWSKNALIQSKTYRVVRGNRFFHVPRTTVLQAYVRKITALILYFTYVIGSVEWIFLFEIRVNAVAIYTVLFFVVYLLLLHSLLTFLHRAVVVQVDLYF